MFRKNINMVDGPMAKNIIRFALPIVAMGLMQNLFVACDMATLGFFAGSNSLGAVGATNYLVNLFVNAFIGLSVGANVIAAQAIGAGDRQRVSRVVHTAVTSAVVFGMLLLVLGVSFSDDCLRFMGTPGDIIDRSILYLRIYFFATPATLFFHFGASILRASGNSTAPFVYITSAGALNVILNLFFVAVCGMDVAGVALGTIISQYLAAALVLRHLLSETGIVRLNPKKLGISMGELKDILRVGVPTGINNMVFSISNTQIQSGINMFGAAAVAGCSASNTLEMIVYAATNSIMQTTISFTGQNVGAKRTDNLRKVMCWCLLYSSLIGLALGLFMVAICRPLLAPILQDEAALAFAVMRTQIILSVFFICGIMEVFAGMLRGLGYSMLPTVVTLIGACGFRIIWVHTVFKATVSLPVLFYSFPISWGLTAAAHGLCLAWAMHKLHISFKA